MLALLISLSATAQKLPQPYAAIDVGVASQGNYAVVPHAIVKYHSITAESDTRLYFGANTLPCAFGGRIGYEYGSLLSITPYVGYYYLYSGTEEYDKTQINSAAYGYAVRVKWCPSSFDAAGLYLDVSSVRSLQYSEVQITSVTFGMTLFEPNNR